jgi:hypothetical protein
MTKRYKLAPAQGAVSMNTLTPSGSGLTWFPRFLGAACITILGVGVAAMPARAADVPELLRMVIPEGKPASERAVAEQDVLVLNGAMMGIYENSLAKYKKSMREHVPIILALFSGGGGRMILYRPGQEPLEAEPVPKIYALTKSVAHSSMATYQIVAPYLANPADTSWHGPMQSYRAQSHTAYDSLHSLDMSSDDREVLASILKHNIAFMDECLSKGTFTYAELEKFTHDLMPYIPKAIAIGANAQVSHWMKVLDAWKTMLGKDWVRTYAVTNSLYVTRRNNILFTVLAQFMGEEAFGDRLLLLETTEFTTTPDTMLDLLARIVSDRALGQVFFKDAFLMDVELLGGGARKVIAEEAKKLGMKPLIPPLSPFHSHAWPWSVDPKSGAGPSTMEEVK